MHTASLSFVAAAHLALFTVLSLPFATASRVCPLQILLWYSTFFNQVLTYPLCMVPLHYHLRRQCMPCSRAQRVCIIGLSAIVILSTTIRQGWGDPVPTQQITGAHTTISHSMRKPCFNVPMSITRRVHTTRPQQAHLWQYVYYASKPIMAWWSWCPRSRRRHTTHKIMMKSISPFGLVGCGRPRLKGVIYIHINLTRPS